MQLGLETYTWSGAKIQKDLALLEETIFLVELDQLEGGTGSVALLFGELVPLVKTTFSVFLLDRHFDKVRCSRAIQESLVRSVCCLSMAMKEADA